MEKVISVQLKQHQRFASRSDNGTPFLNQFYFRPILTIIFRRINAFFKYTKIASSCWKTLAYPKNCLKPSGARNMAVLSWQKKCIAAFQNANKISVREYNNPVKHLQANLGNYVLPLTTCSMRFHRVWPFSPTLDGRICKKPIMGFRLPTSVFQWFLGQSPFWVWKTAESFFRTDFSLFICFINLDKLYEPDNCGLFPS